MIIITISAPIKCPGMLSAFIQFPYNEEILNVIKLSDCHIYNKKTRTWEIDITSLPKILDKLTLLDDIQLIDNDNYTIMNSNSYKVNFTEFKTQPFDYQLEGIEYGLNHNNWLLLDAPGLGKTLQVIYIAEQLKKYKNIEHCLIICGINTLKYNWKKEIEKHSNLSCMILGEKLNTKGKYVTQGIQYRLSQLKEKINEFFVIMNIETLRDTSILKQINSGINSFDMIIVDEIHCCKSQSSQQGHNLLKLSSAKYKIGLTGTVILNSPFDCYVPLKWIGCEHSNFSTFKNYYCKYGGLFNHEIIGYKNIDVLKEQLNQFSLRRTKNLLNLPEKNIIDELIEMNDDQRNFYNDILSGVFDKLDKVSLNDNQILSLIVRLRQATSCPTILTSSNIQSSKIQRAIDLTEQIIQNGDKVVIYSIFKETLNQLQKILNSKALLCTGDIDNSIIQKNIELFQSNSNYNILLCTPQKMGTGITLTSASYMIFIDCPWTAAVCEQCEDRIHRIGSKDPVFIYYLWNNDTFDLKIKDLISDKSILENWVVDDYVDPNFVERLKKLVFDLKIS